MASFGFTLFGWLKEVCWLKRSLSGVELCDCAKGTGMVWWMDGRPGNLTITTTTRCTEKNQIILQNDQWRLLFFSVKIKDQSCAIILQPALETVSTSKTYFDWFWSGIIVLSISFSYTFPCGFIRLIPNSLSLRQRLNWFFVFVIKFSILDSKLLSVTLVGASHLFYRWVVMQPVV